VFMPKFSKKMDVYSFKETTNMHLLHGLSNDNESSRNARKKFSSLCENQLRARGGGGWKCQDRLEPCRKRERKWTATRKGGFYGPCSYRSSLVVLFYGNHTDICARALS
jgi:hypothetical protein